MMKKALLLAVVLGVAVSANANLIPNGDFETILGPDGLPCTVEDGMYWNIPNQTMQGDGVATYADGTTGTDIVAPGWVMAAASVAANKTNADVMQGGTWGGPEGEGDAALLCFASWGGPTVVETAAPLSIPVLNAGEVLALSADVYGNGGPVVLELLVDGVVITPDFAADPALVAGTWTNKVRTYSSIPAGDVTVVVGTRDDAGTGWTGNRVSIDNVALSVVPEPATMALLGLGGLALIRRKRA